MTKEQILKLTGLTEAEFYKKYPTKEAFYKDYPNARRKMERGGDMSGGSVNTADLNKDRMRTTTRMESDLEAGLRGAAESLAESVPIIGPLLKAGMDAGVKKFTDSGLRLNQGTAHSIGAGAGTAVGTAANTVMSLGMSGAFGGAGGAGKAVSTPFTKSVKSTGQITPKLIQSGFNVQDALKKVQQIQNGIPTSYIPGMYDTGVYTAMNGGMYRDGGVMNNTSNLGLTDLKGPRHADGGIALNEDVEVEGEETIYTPERYVFSEVMKASKDALKEAGLSPSYAGRSYSSISRSFKNSVDTLRGSEDKLAQRAVDQKLKKLISAHEVDRANKREREAKNVVAQTPEERAGGYNMFPDAESIMFPGQGQATVVPADNQMPIEVTGADGSQQILTNSPVQTEAPFMERKMKKGGKMIKRADGSYSRRGLWDNIRANRGSGKKPTKQMLEQERKIRAAEKAMGGYYYDDGGELTNPPYRSIDTTRKIDLNIPKYYSKKDKILNFYPYLSATNPEPNVNVYYGGFNTDLNLLNKNNNKLGLNSGLGTGIVTHPGGTEYINPQPSIGLSYSHKFNNGGYMAGDGSDQPDGSYWRSSDDMTYYMYGGGLKNYPTMQAEGGKLPEGILRARLESHMSPSEVESYMNEYQIGGTLPVTYVDDPDDPRLKAYNDSLNVYRSHDRFVNAIKAAKPKNLEETERLSKKLGRLQALNQWDSAIPMKPIRTYDLNTIFYKTPGYSYPADPRYDPTGRYEQPWRVMQYKKPRKPYELKKEEPIIDIKEPITIQSVGLQPIPSRSIPPINFRPLDPSKLPSPYFPEHISKESGRYWASSSGKEPVKEVGYPMGSTQGADSFGNYYTVYYGDPSNVKTKRKVLTSDEYNKYKETPEYQNYLDFKKGQLAEDNKKAYGGDLDKTNYDVYVNSPSYFRAEGGSFDNPGFRALPEYVQNKIKSNMEDGGELYMGEMPEYADMEGYELDEDEAMNYGEGGSYRVYKSNERKGKTHKVVGPGGKVKYFGDPKLGERSKSKYGKKAFYARHRKNLAKNPFFRAYARATWEDGGYTSLTPQGLTFTPTINRETGGEFGSPDNNYYFGDASGSYLNAMQQGGMMPMGAPQQAAPSQGDQMQQIMQAVAQMLQETQDPAKVVQALVQKGLSKEDAGQIVQTVLQQMQEAGSASKQAGTLGENQVYENQGMPFQEGGMMVANPVAQPEVSQEEAKVMQAVAGMLMQGAQPEQVLQQLLKAGVPQEASIAIIKNVMQQMQAESVQQPGSPEQMLGMGQPSEEEMAMAQQQGMMAYGGPMQYKKGGIYIKPSKRGSFTAWAKRHDMGVQEAARHVMANKEDYSSAIVKKANFAKNAAGWKHAMGGRLKYAENFGVLPVVDNTTTEDTTDPTYSGELKVKPYKSSLAPYIVGGISSAMGPIANMIAAGAVPDATYTPPAKLERLGYTPVSLARQLANQNIAANREAMRMNSGSEASYLSNLGVSLPSTASALGSLLAQTRYGIDTSNVGIANQEALNRQAVAQQNALLKDQSIAQRWNLGLAGAEGIGKGVQGLSKDLSQRTKEDEMIRSLKTGDFSLLGVELIDPKDPSKGARYVPRYTGEAMDVDSQGNRYVKIGDKYYKIEEQE